MGSQEQGQHDNNPTADRQITTINVACGSLQRIFKELFGASRRSAVGLAGCAPRFVPNRGHLALIPDASGP
jgi:hypothetical protein